MIIRNDASHFRSFAYLELFGRTVTIENFKSQYLNF